MGQNCARGFRSGGGGAMRARTRASLANSRPAGHLLGRLLSLLAVHLLKRGRQNKRIEVKIIKRAQSNGAEQRGDKTRGCTLGRQSTCLAATDHKCALCPLGASLLQRRRQGGTFLRPRRAPLMGHSARSRPLQAGRSLRQVLACARLTPPSAANSDKCARVGLEPAREQSNHRGDRASDLSLRSGGRECERRRRRRKERARGGADGRVARVQFQ